MKKGRKGTLLSRRRRSPPFTKGFPKEAVAEFRAVLDRLSAKKRAANAAIRTTCHAARRYMIARTVKPVSGASLQRQLKAMLYGIVNLERAMARLSGAAMHELRVTGDSHSTPEAERDLRSEGLEASRIQGRYERLRREAHELGLCAQLTLARVTVQTRHGRRKNEAVDTLFADAIGAWKSATGKWPSAGQTEDGQARSPLPQLLRNLVSRIAWSADYRARKKALSDDRYFAVLRDVKLQDSTKGERPARRRSTKR